MKKIFLLLIFFAIAQNAFAAPCLTALAALDCTPGVSPQCACTTKFDIKNSAGVITDTFNAGDTLYVDITVENVGTQTINNSRYFIITENGMAFANGIYAQMIDGGVDLAVGDEISYSNIPVQLKNHDPPSPPDYRLYIFVASVSNFYFHIPLKTYKINNPATNWIGTLVPYGIRKTGDPAYSGSIDTTPGQQFDLMLRVQSTNPTDPITVQYTVETRYIQSCTSAPIGWNIGTGTNTSIAVPVNPGVPVDFYLDGCNLFPVFETGSISIVFWAHTLGGDLLGATGAQINQQIPQVGYFNFWADKPFLANGDTTTFSSEFEIRYGDLPPGSRMVFRFLNVRDTAGAVVAVPDEVINFPAGLPKNNVATPRYTQPVAVSSYAAALASFNFTVEVLFYDNVGTLLGVFWGNSQQAFAPNPPLETIDLSTGLGEIGNPTCTDVVIVSGNSQITCNLNAGDNVLIQSATAPVNVQLAGGSAAIQYTGTNTKVLALSPAVITITITLPTAVPDLNIFDTIVIIIMATMFLAAIAKNPEKIKTKKRFERKKP